MKVEDVELERDHRSSLLHSVREGCHIQYLSCLLNLHNSEFGDRPSLGKGQAV